MKPSPALFISLLLTATGLARAESGATCAGDRPWVTVSCRVPAPFAAAVRSELRAGLAPSRIDVCEAAPAAAEPLAHVTIDEVEGEQARYRLEVTDAVTHKRVIRDLGLENLPPDGRALALAVAAEELLRASWAELALRGAHSAQTAAPPEVRAIVDEGPPAPEPGRFTALGARLAFEHFGGGQAHYGADVFGDVPLARVASVLAALGVRRALSYRAPHGSIDATVFSAEAALSLAFWQRRGADLRGVAGVRLLRLEFEAEPEPGARAESHRGFAVSARGGLLFAIGKAGVVRSYSMLGAGLVFQSFAAADSGEVVTAASGLELFGSTGLALELP